MTFSTSIREQMFVVLAYFELKGHISKQNTRIRCEMLRLLSVEGLKGA